MLIKFIDLGYRGSWYGSIDRKKLYYGCPPGPFKFSDFVLFLIGEAIKSFKYKKKIFRQS